MQTVDDVKEILALGRAHRMVGEAQRFIDDGKNAREFKDHILGESWQRNLDPINLPDTGADMGMSRRELKEYSLSKAILALAEPGKPYLRDNAGLVFEISQQIEKDTRRTAKGVLVPSDVISLNLRDMSTQVDSAGGYLVATQMGQLIEKQDNALVVKELGCIILPDLVGDLAIPKQTGGATAYWIGETEDVTESAPALGQVGLRPHTVGCYTDLTRKLLLQSSIGAEMFVRNDLALRVALEIDRVALNGSGASNEPMGILNTTGIGSVTLDAQNAPDWEDIVDMETAVAVDNALVGKLAYTCGATIQGAMKKTARHATATMGFILGAEGKDTLNMHKFMMSNQVPAKHILFGNWADLIIGQWSGVDVNVDTSTLSRSGGLRVVVLQDIDVAVRHAESFADGYHV